MEYFENNFTAPANSDKIVMWRFLRNRPLILRLHRLTIFRPLTYWAHRAVILAIAWFFCCIVGLHSCVFMFMFKLKQTSTKLVHSIYICIITTRCSSAYHGIEIACRPPASVRLPSVTLVDQDHIGWKSCKLIARTINPKPLLCIAQRTSTYSQGNKGKFGE